MVFNIKDVKAFWYWSWRMNIRPWQELDDAKRTFYPLLEICQRQGCNWHVNQLVRGRPRWWRLETPCTSLNLFRVLTQPHLKLHTSGSGVCLARLNAYKVHATSQKKQNKTPALDSEKPCWPCSRLLTRLLRLRYTAGLSSTVYL